MCEASIAAADFGETCLPQLDCLLDHRTQEGAAAALELLASHPEAAFSMVAEGAVPRLVDCLERPSSDAALLSAARSLFILACADGGVLPQVVRSRGVEIMIQCCWRSCLAVQGVVLAMLQQLALQPAYQHDCCIHGMIGLLMWLARSNFPSEVEDVANESLAELSRYGKGNAYPFKSGFLGRRS